MRSLIRVARVCNDVETHRGLLTCSLIDSCKVHHDVGDNHYAVFVYHSVMLKAVPSKIGD